MSLTTGLIAIKGNHLESIPEIAAVFRHVDTPNSRAIDNWNEVELLINDIDKHSIGDFRETHVLWNHNGWTIMEDMTLNWCTDEKALATLSQRLNAPVFSLVTQGTSNCFGFWYYDHEKIRGFYIEDGDITENSGEPLAQEAKFAINESAFYDDVHGVAKEMGIDWAAAENHHYFLAKTFEADAEYKQELQPLVDKYLQNQLLQSAGKKPWWKFW